MGVGANETREQDLPVRVQQVARLHTGRDVFLGAQLQDPSVAHGERRPSDDCPVRFARDHVWTDHEEVGWDCLARH